MNANQLLKHNIDTLLRGRGQSRKDLAQWCRRGESWISKIFNNAHREIPLKYLDRIADFFGIATYQLFQPGISPLTERRRGDRRSGSDRRIGHQQRELLGVAAELQRVRPSRDSYATPSVPAARLRSLVANFERELATLHRLANPGGQTLLAGEAQPEPLPRRRHARRSDHPTTEGGKTKRPA